MFCCDYAVCLQICGVDIWYVARVSCMTHTGTHCRITVKWQLQQILLCCLCRDVDDGSLVFAHQTQWQRRLLSRYGTHMCLIDATYKTTVYEMPLFFLCVPANVGYFNVATFLLTDERCDSIAAGLNQILEWNRDWQPTNFLTDFHEGQISALEAVFPGCVPHNTCYSEIFIIHQSTLSWNFGNKSVRFYPI